MSTWREKLKAATHGEVSRDGLDPYKAAGAGVYEYVLELDQLRSQAAEHQNVRAALLAGWVAFALQVLGAEMLDADEQVDPSTAHFVPPVTAQQVTDFYEPVQGWMAKARAAKANPGYRLDVPLPVVLPEWVEVEPCPSAHLLALRSAVARFREQTEGVMAGYELGPADGHAREVVAQGAAEAASAADYANGLWGALDGPAPQKVHEAIEANLKHAAESYFYLGQILAMPSIADIPQRVRRAQEDSPANQSFLGSLIAAYPQIAQRRRGGFGGIGGGILGGIIGGEIAREIFGGGFGGGFGGDDDGGWGNQDGGDWF